MQIGMMCHNCMDDRPPRKILVEERLSHLPAAGLLGPRQVGKTTLAHSIGVTRSGIYLDLESPVDREKLGDPVFYLSGNEDKLVILDEVSPRARM
jgi:predicted AAA+ superfamily ATPase